MSIPFSFTVYGNQPLEVSYWLRMRSESGGGWAVCDATGGLCNVVQIAENASSIDYSHTLRWQATNVTDWFGTPVDYDITSSSGFDYTVPEPGAAASLGAALAAIGTLARRRATSLPR